MLQSVLVLLLVLTAVSLAFVLQDLPLERFERSSNGYDLSPLERQTRAGGLIYRPVPNFLARYRYLNNEEQQQH